jgi:hypothetical protein
MVVLIQGIVVSKRRYGLCMLALYCIYGPALHVSNMPFSILFRRRTRCAYRPVFLVLFFKDGYASLQHLYLLLMWSSRKRTPQTVAKCGVLLPFIHEAIRYIVHVQCEEKREREFKESKQWHLVYLCSNTPLHELLPNYKCGACKAHATRMQLRDAST